MAPEAAWSLQVWEEGGLWHWDVRSPGLRCTGERALYQEACEIAVAELTEMQAAHREARARGLRRP